MYTQFRQNIWIYAVCSFIHFCFCASIHCILSPLVILEVLGLFVAFILFLIENPIANNVEPDQMLHYVTSDLGLHCLPRTLLWVSRKRVKG